MDMGLGSAGLGAGNEAENAFRQWNFWVDAALGSDSNSGGPGDPFQTIQRAINMSDEKVNPGENNIYINKGLYNEDLSIRDDDLLRLIGNTGNPYDVMITGSSDDAIYIDGGSRVELMYLRTFDSYQGIYAYDLDFLKLFKVVSDQNEYDGLYAENISTVQISFSDFMDNGDDGIDVYDASDVHVTHGFFGRNGDEGLEFYDNGLVAVSNISAVDNVDDGFDSENANTVNITGSYFATNGDDGADIEDTYGLKIVASNFYKNDENGLELYDNSSVQLIVVNSTENGQSPNGEFLSASSSSYEFFEGNGLSLYGSDYLKIQDGNYSRNNNDGAYIEETDQINLMYAFMKENGDDGVEADYFEYAAVRGGEYRANEDDGINMYGGRFESNGPPQFQANIISFGNESDVSIVGGLFWDNGDEGIELDQLNSAYLRAVNAQRNGTDGIGDGVDVDYTNDVRLLNSILLNNHDDGAEIDDVGVLYANHNVSKNNGGDGMDVDRGHELNIMGGVYSYNGEDGLDLDGDDYFYDPLENVHVFWVDASRNEDDGLSVYEAEHVSVMGGVYLFNGESGLMFTDVDSVWSKDTVSQFNGADGMTIFGGESGNGFLIGNEIGYTHVHIIRGNYSFNENDGLLMLDVGNVMLQFVFGSNNDDDGLEVLGATSVDLGSSTFVANGDQNVNIVL